MNVPTRVLGISGSLRRASHNTGLLRAAQSLAPDGMVVDLFDITPLPFYNYDLEQEGEPATVIAMKAAIRSADALLLATPEYNYSVTAPLKNAIDWASRPVRTSPLNGRPVAILGAGGAQGTVRAQAHLRQILLHNGMLVLAKPELYVPRSSEKFDRDGTLTDEHTRQSLSSLLIALQAWITRVRLQTDG